jgi:hypothetical protein
LLSRAIATLVISVAAMWVFGFTASAGAAEEATTCDDASLARDRTEVDTDLLVSQFDPSLGTLLSVSVNGPSIVLDTDSKFENIAKTAVQFSETMNYQVVATSPGGLASPAPITGTVQRIPPQTLAAFDGTLDFAGPSSVTQAPASVAESAAATSATDASTLAAFTGTGTMPFHLASTISEVFNGGGGNVQFQINTYLAATVEVCYRYELPAPPVTPPSMPPPAPPSSPPAVTPPPATPIGATLPMTGRASVPLAVAAVALIAAGMVLSFSARASRVSRARLEA